MNRLKPLPPKEHIVVMALIKGHLDEIVTKNENAWLDPDPGDHEDQIHVWYTAEQFRRAAPWHHLHKNEMACWFKIFTGPVVRLSRLNRWRVSLFGDDLVEKSVRFFNLADPREDAALKKELRGRLDSARRNLKKLCMKGTRGQL